MDTTKPVALKVKELIVKVASRCNLNCSYCYVYNKGDDTWRRQPRVMSSETVEALMHTVRRHCERHGLEWFVFHFHGGEPMLCGPAFFVDFVAAARRVLEPAVRPRFMMQTNGTLLDDEWCRLLNELEIGYGISIDGPEAIHDRNRVDHAGRGSYRQVRAGIEAMMRAAAGTNNRHGVLTVIDLAADPIASYEHLKELGVHSADFLLPDSTIDQPPPGFAPGETPYADWLIPIFDRWFAERPMPIRLRLFELIVAQILGSSRKVDYLGAGANEMLFIETDGGIAPSVILNICSPGITDVGANVFTHELDDVLQAELVQQYHLSGQRLCGTCRACPVSEICGGGYLPHRYSAHNGFDNPSVYCADLMKLITHVRCAVGVALPAEKRRPLRLEPLSFEEAKRRLPVASHKGRRASLPLIA